MKKITIYLIMLVSIAIFAACDQLNETPVFDDANAFVAFTSESLSVTEDAESLLVPIRLTSLANKTATVTYEVIDGTAQKGVDFDVAAGANVLAFDGTSSVMNIELDILSKIGTFTGDLKFSVIIKTATGVNVGSNDTTVVTINDIDHPLASILGDYVGSGDDTWGDGVYSWDDVVFEKDPLDVTKVWIVNIFSGYSSTIKVYGVVNEDLTEISVPVYQSVGTVSGYNAYFEGASIPFAQLVEGEKLTFTIDDGVVALQGDFEAGVTAYNATTEAFAGWFERVSDLTFIKK